MADLLQLRTTSWKGTYPLPCFTPDGRSWDFNPRATREQL